MIYPKNLKLVKPWTVLQKSRTPKQTRHKQKTILERTVRNSLY